MQTVNSQPPSLVRKIEFGRGGRNDAESLDREWLVTNGLGGYASGMLSGAAAWRYHGLLVAALPSPAGRTMMLNHLQESLYMPDRRLITFGGGEVLSPTGDEPPNYLTEFRLEHRMPVWRYDVEGVIIEKRILMPYLQNTVHITFTLQSKHEGIFLELRPSLHFRPFEANSGSFSPDRYRVHARGMNFEIDAGADEYPPLRLCVVPSCWRFIHEGGTTREVRYGRDAERGYDAGGTLWTPGYFSASFLPEVPVTLIASTESWHTIHAMEPEAALTTEMDRRRHLLRLARPGARTGVAAELVLAADHFIISPAGRIKDAARAHAAGDELRSVIAGYHWFTDWGRDTMISLEGLALTTGRFHEARWILRTFAHYVRDGLIPNMFPEGGNDGLYHTADATLWFFHALHRYVEVTRDRETLAALLPVLRSVVEHHLRGTRFGIGVDSEDGLLRQGAEGYQLTWMDAKVGDWVVTPRRGKAVEINALWYNALKLLEGWLREMNDREAADSLARQAERTRTSFNERFWNPRFNCLYDVIDGPGDAPPEDPAIRPNQLLAISLANPVLERERWEAVIKVVEDQLVTPVGLRSLSRDHRDYKPKYYGDLRSRDAAYHQGTVWTWLLGPFIDAWLKVHPGEHTKARRFLDGFGPHLSRGCVGVISEIFDAESPFTERGCIAQAWSVAEVLRCLEMTSEDGKT